MSVTLPFTYISSADQSWQVPAGITSINVSLIGAGGGYTAGRPGGGGRGGLVSGTFAVTPGETLLLAVGAGGVPGPGFTGTGGKLVAIKRGATIVVAAGSGGGGGADFIGGAGGGLVGADGGGGGGYPFGLGGTQTDGGMGGGDRIAAKGGYGVGGAATGDYGGMGGAGYYGGGSTWNGGGGGGGSSYVDLLTGTVVNTQGGGAAQLTNGSISITYNPIMCFVSESNLLTPSGYKEAKDIKTGDLLMTADGRKVPIKAYRTTLTVNKDSAPFLVPKNALGMGCPKADLRLSPWHAIQMNNGLWMKPMSLSELVPGSVQQYDIGKVVTYYHFEAPNFFKDNLVCDGTVVESYGGDQLDNVKGRVYNYDSKLEAYTRISGKPAAKKLMM